MRLVPDTTSPGLLVNSDWKPNTPGTFAILIGVSRYDFLSTRAGATDTYGLGQLHVSALTAYRFLRWLEEQYRYDQNNGSPLARCWLLLSPTDEERALIEREEADIERNGALLGNPARPTLDECNKAINAWFGTMDGLKLFPKAAQASRAFFFFSGHGLEVSSEQQILLPCDYLDPQYHRNLNRALSTHNLFAGLAELAVPHQFFFLDACRNDVRELREMNPVGSPILSEPPAYRSNSERIAPLFYASASGGQAWQASSAAKGLSLFGQALLDGLRQPGCPAGFCPVNVFTLMPFLQQRVNEQLAKSRAAVRQPIRLSGSIADVEISFVQAKPVTLSAEDEFEIPRPPANPIQFRDIPLAPAGAIPKSIDPAAIDVNAIFEDAAAREIWNSMRIYSFAKGAWLPQRGAYRIHRAARADQRAYQIVLSLPNERGNHWLELSEPARLDQALRFACVLPAAEDGTTRYLIELELNGERLERLEAGLAEDNSENLGRAALLWNQYQSLNLAAAAAGAADLRSTAALLRQSIQSGLAATVAALILLRSRVKDERAFQDWLDQLADWFPDLPDGPVLLAEQILRVSRAEQPPAEAIEQLLLLRARGLPVTSDAFSYAARQAEDLLRALPADAPDAAGLALVHGRMQDALRFFRAGGLFSAFAGPIQGLKPALLV